MPRTRGCTNHRIIHHVLSARRALTSCKWIGVNNLLALTVSADDIQSHSNHSKAIASCLWYVRYSIAGDIFMFDGRPRLREHNMFVCSQPLQRERHIQLPLECIMSAVTKEHCLVRTRRALTI